MQPRDAVRRSPPGRAATPQAWRISIVAKLSGVTTTSVLRGINATLLRHGCLPHWVQSLGPGRNADTDAVHEWDPHAIVLVTAAHHELRQELLAGRVVVSVEEDMSSHGIPSILVDDRALGADAADHLLARGLAHLAAFGHDQYPFSVRRVAGFRERALAAGAGYHPGDAWPQATTSSGRGIDRWRSWLSDLPKPVGVFAACDSWAATLLNLCRMAELRVPDDVALVGACDDPLFCEVSHPRLTSVPIPFEEMGRVAAETAVAALDGAQVPATRVLRPSAVAARASSDVPVDAPPEVRAALRFIADHASRPIGVDDVVAHAVASRRLLEQAFRRYLKSTILHEIQAARLRRATDLIVNTRMPMAEVAAASGIGNARTLQRLFRREAGASPAAYRQKHRRW